MTFPRLPYPASFGYFRSGSCPVVTAPPKAEKALTRYPNRRSSPEVIEAMKDTADYGARLKALKEEQQRLERKQAELLEKRRAEIGRLAERLGVLEVDDDTFAGALLELKDALSKTGDERPVRWRAAGVSFRRKDKDRKAAPPRADAGVAEPNPDASRR